MAFMIADDGQENDTEVVSFSTQDVDRDAEMDMTPMVDVTFLLLIFFILTASFSFQKSLNVPTPEPEEASTQAQPLDIDEDPEFITVRIDATNTFFVMTTDWEEECPSKEELYVQLRRAREGNSAGQVPNKMVVMANGEAFHERVVAALDAGAAVGIDEVQLMTVEDDEE